MLRHHLPLRGNALAQIDRRMRLPEQLAALLREPRLEPATTDATVKSTVLLKSPDERTA